MQHKMGKIVDTIMEDWLPGIIMVVLVVGIVAIAISSDGDDHYTADVQASSSVEVVSEGQFVHHGQTLNYTLVLMEDSIWCVVATNDTLGEKQPTLSCIPG